jgi:nitroimidazol reductase NimA-like FMN-containing flavoprotein (pyridoxamine 5'-phosphate oxidase superfamily)
MARTLIPSRVPDRGRSDRVALDQLLDEVLVGYVALSLPEGPLALPVSFARDGEQVLFHGSTGSHRMREFAAGTPICFTVAVVDGIKVGRTAFGTGMRYRSACLFGTCQVLEGADKVAALKVYTDRYLPGRTDEVRSIAGKELAATMVLSLPITEWSMKAADGFVDDDAEDLALDSWAGVIPVSQALGEPIPNPDLRPGIETPGSVHALYQR